MVSLLGAGQGARKEAEQIKREAEKQAAEYMVQSKQNTEQIVAEFIEETKRKAEEESAMIIAKSNELVTQITKEAQERAKKQAEEKKRREAERIIGQAREESTTIVAKAKQTAQEEVT